MRNCTLAIAVIASAVLALPAIARSEPGGPEIEAVFSELPDGTVRHEPSGMECPPAIGEFKREAVEVLDQAGLGRDVACDYRADFDGKLGKLTLFMTDWGRDVPAEDALQATVSAILQRNPGAKPYEGMIVSLTSEGSDFDPARATFLIDIDGTPHVSGAWIQNRLGWSFKLRLTVPEEPWQTQNLIANATMMLIYETITKEARP